MDGIVVMPGYKSPESPYGYAKEIMKGREVPVWIYFNRKANPYQLTHRELAKLIAIYREGIMGVKVSVTDDKYKDYDIQRLRSALALKDGFAYWLRAFLGSEEVLFDHPELAKHGIVSSTANTRPELMVKLDKAIREGNLDELATYRAEIEPNHQRYASAGGSVPVIKQDLFGAGKISSPELSERNPLYKK